MHTKKSKIFVRLVYSIAVFCSSMVLLFSTGIKQSSAAPKARPVVVATAEMREMSPINWYPGTVVSRGQTEVPAEVEGRLIYVAEVGDRLASGAVVAKIDADIMEQERRVVAAETQRVQARLVFLEKEVKRLQRLAKQNNAAQRQLEQSLADLAGARSELAAAKARERLAGKRLQNCVIKAPFDAVLIRRLLKAGEWADGGAGVAVLMDTSQLEIQSWMPVNVLPFVKSGVAIDLDIAGQSSQGVVRVAVPATDSQSRLYELRIVPGRQDLHIGQSVRVAVPAALPRQVLAVPRDALVLRRNSISVFRINDKDFAENLQVTTGIASEDMIEIKGGLQAGDRVVIRGGERLREGLPVTLQSLDGVQ